MDAPVRRYAALRICPERADAAVAEHARQTLRWWGFLNPSFD